MNVFHRIGVHVMENPQRLIAEYLYRAVSRPQLIDFMQLSGNAEIFDIAVAEESAIAGKTLAEAAGEGLLAEDILIVAINPPGDEPPIIPKGGTQIEAGSNNRSVVSKAIGRDVPMSKHVS